MIKGLYIWHLCVLFLLLPLDVNVYLPEILTDDCYVASERATLEVRPPLFHSFGRIDHWQRNQDAEDVTYIFQTIYVNCLSNEIL